MPLSKARHFEIPLQLVSTRGELFPITATIGLLGRSRRPKVEVAPSFGTLVLRLGAIRPQNSAAKISKCDSGAAGALPVGFFAYFEPSRRHCYCEGSRGNLCRWWDIVVGDLERQMYGRPSTDLEYASMQEGPFRPRGCPISPSASTMAAFQRRKGGSRIGRTKRGKGCKIIAIGDAHGSSVAIQTDPQKLLRSLK